VSRVGREVGGVGRVGGAGGVGPVGAVGWGRVGGAGWVGQCGGMVQAAVQAAQCRAAVLHLVVLADARHALVAVVGQRAGYAARHGDLLRRETWDKDGGVSGSVGETGSPGGRGCSQGAETRTVVEQRVENGAPHLPAPDEPDLDVLLHGCTQTRG
jgi:hypothetical protein